jgi:CHAD domain-containing protein
LIWQGTQAQLSIQEGALRGILTDTPVCRVILAGEPRAMAGLAAEMARHLPLQPPLASLAAQARAVAKGVPSPPRRLGAPEIPPQASIDEALTIITAHLADVILYWATQIGSAQTPTPVHQMRVALRRLRSALSVFRRALPESDPWLHDLAAGLKALATLLGTARDWDVFLQTTGAALHQAMPDDRRVAAMMSAAARKRTTAYTALRQCLDGSRPLNEDWKGDLKGNTWRDLAITLALLPTRRPWEGPATAKPASGYAPGALARRLRHLTLNGESLEGLPPEHLHDIRKHAKRLRYAIEFFQPFFPEKAVRKYLGRLETLQEDFGALNDSAVAAALAASLGNPFAAGAVQGYCAARGGRSAKKLQRGWAKFYFETPFWD